VRSSSAGPEVDLLHAGPSAGEERAELELTCLRGELEPCKRLESLVVLMALDSGLGARDRRLDLCVLVPGLARLEIRDVDTEPLADPTESFLRRPASCHARSG